jgi:hypothetical protein
MIGKLPQSGNFRRLMLVPELPTGGISEMERRIVSLSSVANSRARSVLADRLAQHPSPHVAPAHAPESIMAISFEGLTEREQEAALAAFPGGKRFVLQG